MNTKGYLNALKEERNIKSDYALGTFTGWSRSTISTYRTKPQYLSDKHCLQVAEWLDLSPGKVIADIHAERTKSPELKIVWQQVAKTMQAAALSLALITCGIFFTPDNSAVFASIFTDNNIHYAHY